MSLRIGIPQIGMRASRTLYQVMEAAATEAALRNGAALWYVGQSPDGWVYEDSTGTTPSTGTDPVGLLLDRSRVAGESYGADKINFSGAAGWTANNGGILATVNGELEVTADGVANFPGATRSVTVIPGAYYRITFTGRRGTQPTGIGAALSNVTPAYNTVFNTTTVNVTVTQLFQATSTTIGITLFAQGTPALAGTTYFSAVVIQEAIGNLGPEKVTVNSAVMTGAIGNTAITSETLTAGAYYSYSYAISQSSGASQLSFGGTALGPVELGAVSTTRTGILLATTTTALAYYSNAAVGTISNVSLKQLLGYPALQATAANKPTLELQANGYYGMRFDGVNDTLSTAIVAASAGNTTIYALAQLSYSAYLGGFFNSPEGQYMTTGATSVSVNDNVNTSAGITGDTSTNTFGVPAVLTGATRSGSQKVWKNGTLANSTTAAIAPSTTASSLYGIAVAGVTLPGAYKQGLYFLVCVGPASMSSADRIAIERFAALLSGVSYSSSPLILDQIAPSAAAYSLRKLTNSYTGPAIRVRRSSDNAEQDIEFVGGDLDTTALLAFTGANSGFVTVWYDQSGSARHATQTTAANQPRIVNAGVMHTLNGRPTVDQVAVSGKLNIPVFSGMTSAIVSAVYAQAAVQNGFAPWQLNQIDHLPWTNTLAYAGPFSTTRPQFSAWAAAANELIVASAVQTGTAVEVYRNGTQNGTTQTSAFTLPSTQGNRTIFGGLTGTGFVSELIVMSAWDGGPTNRQTLERNQGNFYGITVA